ncbi:hypothetical protein YYC_05522 [Plasmodium yoelii 17X]|uniref:Rh5 coiled-coil domain-containing protein n=1 Tax=Plasmodium yoelii 17X TaxID=1323249 RepID=V7PDP7_PLAYE|nr:hypothetical protein YYC_05522 [Plasmodium yoelii 17X]
MKKLIYITTTYIVLFTSLGVIYGKKIETGKKNHDGQLNNFYLYNNLKGINFNNSNSSNEEQYNNKNDVINDKFIQPNSITYLENQKDTANDKVILYNDYTNKNDLDTFKFFNNDNEKTNRKATIVKSSFIQNSNPTRFDSSMYNTIDILYNVSGPNENLKYFYVKLYFYQELRTFLNNIYSNAKKPVNIPRSTPLQIDNDINLIIKECELQKTNLINEMSKLHNPLYEFYKESTKDDYNPYSNYRKSYVDCMLPRFKKLEPKIDAAISSMQSEYDHLCYYEYWNVDALYKEYATTTKQYMDSQLDVISNHLVIHGMGISSHGNRLSKILESEGEQGSIISKLKFLSNEIECTLNKYSNYKNECTSNYTFMVNYVQHDTYRQYYYYYLREIKKIAQQRANFIYNFNKLKHLKLLYKQQEGIMRNFHKTIERLIFGKPDPNNTNVFKEYIYEFNLWIPKSKLTALEKRFFEIFEEKWNSYEIKKDIDENSKQYNVVKLILQYMKELTDLIDFMDNYQPDEVPTRSIIGFEVEWRINQTLYTEVEAGVKKSYESVKNWRKSMVEINKKLEEENEKVIKLETQINDLFNQYLKINDENIYLNKLKLELKEKIKNISDKNEYVKKAVDLKKTIENNNIYIDELTKTSPYQVPEHLKNTDTIYNTIKLELSQIYEDDIDKLYNELSSIVQENDIDNVEDKTKLDDLQSKIDNVYSKIQNMENETVESHLTNIETNKNKLSDTILAIKKYIYGEISKDLNKTLEDFKNKEKELSNKINDYAKENDQLNVYKSKISEIRNHYNSQINIDNTKEGEAKQNYDKSNEHMTKISTNENEISKFINEVKSMKDAFLSKVDKYINFDNNYKENVNLEHTQFTELTDKIKAEVSDEKLSKHEKSFNDSKSLINETKNSIEKEYQNINTLKKVDEYIKVCEITKESITKFSSKQNTLKCMLNQNIKTVKETNSIENFYKDKFENTLTNKINELDKTFKDASLNDYELNNNELMQYFNNLKENLGKDKENMLYNQLAEKEKTFNDIKKNNTHINEEISNIEIAIYASIYNISEEIKNEIGKNIELLNAKVVEKVKANVTNLNEIKEKLKHYNFHDFGKDENIKYANEVNKIKDDIKTVSQQIDHHINKLEDIKKKSGSYVGEMKEQIDKLEKVPDTAISNDTVEGIEKKQKIIVTKIDKNKNIYEEIDKLLSEISKIEKDQTSLEKVKGINLSYGQSLGNLFLEQIDEEKKKAEHTIKAMESYMEDLDNIKKKSQEIETEMDIKMDINQEMEALKISHDDDKKWDAKSKSYKKNISDIYDKSSKIIKDLSNESDINDIKNKLQKNVSESQKHNSEINQCLSEVANIYNILKLNKIKKIIDKVKEYTSEIEKNKKNINDELNNSGKVIKKIEDDLSLKECKSKIESTLDDKDIDKCIKNITNLKTYILSEETNIANHFKNAEEYNKNVLLNFHNIEMADNKSQYILKIKKNNDTSNHDYNIKELKEHKDKSNGYKTEADKNKKAIEKNKELFEKYKEEVTVLLNKYYAVELKNKFDKTKKGSEQIIKEIKETHNKFILELGKSKQKMNEIKNEQIHIGDEVANNDKSNKAIASIKISVEPFETKFLKINDIKKKSDEYLKETESIEKKLSNLSIDSQETKLKENEGKLNTLKELLESLKNQKKNIEDRKKELDEVNSKIQQIERDVNQHKKDYEIGIVEKIKENADTNKKQIESTKELIQPTIQNIISSFDTNDLEDINTNANLEKYNTEMNNIYKEFIKSYNLIAKYPEMVSKEPITYDQIKNKRMDTQKELLKNIEHGNKAKSYLDYVKENEFDRIVTHFKNKLNTVNDKFKVEYLKANEGFDNISKSINNVKNSTDENSLLNILNQTKQMYENIVSKTYNSYKYEAENIFINIPKLANSLNIQIKNSSGIDLFKNMNIAILPYLDSQKKDTLTFIPSPQKTSETYTKISDSYNTLLDILKKSQELQKKEQQTLNLILENQRLYEKVQATNELKGTLSDLKYKKEKILNEVKLLLHKSNELKKLSCSSQNYDTILESSKYNQIKEKNNNYEQEKNKLGIDFDVTSMEEKFNNDIKAIEKLENNYNSTEENDNILQSKNKLNELTKAFNTEIKDIEDKMIKKNDLIDKLVEARKDCLLFTYKTLVETLKSKVANHSEFITSAAKFSKEFLKYIDDISNSLNDDINTLQINHNLNQTNKHVPSILADATKNHNNLIEKEKEATQILNNLTNLFTIDSNNIDADTLYNNKLQMIYFNSELHKSIESIKQLYKKMYAFKLLNIAHINGKYFDISKEFDNILQLQKHKLTENLNNLNQIDQYISDKKNEFLHALNETTNPNLNTLKEIYHDIVNYESQIDEIKNISNKENENITSYIDTITKLTEKVQNILDYVTTYENNNNIIKQHIQDNDENHVSQIKDNLKTTIQSFQQVHNKINEIKAQFYGNNNINNIITTILQNVNDVKNNFSKDLTIENELIQIQKSLEDIQNSTHEIRSEQITKYANTIYNHIEQQTKQIQNNSYKDEVYKINEIDNIIQKIINYNKEPEIKLHAIIDNQNKVTSIISRIKNIINLIESEYSNNNNVSYNVAIKHIENANNIILDLNRSRNILNHLIHRNLNIINNLKNIKQHMLSRNNLHTINSQEETSKIKYPSNTHYNNVNDTKYKNYQHSNSGKKGSYKTKNAGDSVKYAGAIVFGLVACYAISIFKKHDEKNEINLGNDEKNYGESENIYFEREDEIIEIDINED